MLWDCHPCVNTRAWLCCHRDELLSCCCCFWAHSFSLKPARETDTLQIVPKEEEMADLTLYKCRKVLFMAGNYCQCYLIQDMHIYVLSEYFTLSFKKLLNVALLPCNLFCFHSSRWIAVFYITKTSKCPFWFSYP